MLVLSRKVDEEILIGSSIRVIVARIKGGNVRLGIAAPSLVRVIRKELRHASSPAKKLELSGAS